MSSVAGEGKKHDLGARRQGAAARHMVTTKSREKNTKFQVAQVDIWQIFDPGGRKSSKTRLATVAGGFSPTSFLNWHFPCI